MMKRILSSPALNEAKSFERHVSELIERKLKEARIEERLRDLRRTLGIFLGQSRMPEVRHPRASAPRRPSATNHDASSQAAGEVAENFAETAAAAAEVPPNGGAAKTAKRTSAKGKASAARAASKAPTPAKKRAPAKVESGDAIHRELLAALDAHPRKRALIAAGQRKNQLARSLIPLYLVRKSDLNVSSGDTSKFWKALGITYAAPNAAKMLRQNAKYARRGRDGVRITPAGVAFVEAELAAS